MDIGLYDSVPTQDGNIVRLVDSIFSCSLQKAASDIHIEPMDGYCRIRIRVDGLLLELCRLPLIRHNLIISRIKLLSGMDISEKRLPQDGRLNVEFVGRKIDLRIASLPTLRGEKLAIRILDKSKSLIEIEELGFSRENISKYNKMIGLANGLILVTGPTGSGKTTTLYATLKAVNSDEKNIITIEDPIEYNLEGVNQVAVQRKIGLDFSQGLRAIVRQDPNIIMLGEIRDLASAEIAVQAAMTGHLVFSTLHTNSALGAIDRLIDLGIESFILLNCLRGVVAQRLVRKICPCCKKNRKASDIEKAYLNLDLDNNVELSEGQGCGYCNNTGYKGVFAVQELLNVDDEINSILMQNISIKERKEKLKAYGFRNLKDDGINKVLSGQTTVSELVREAIL